MTDMVVAVREQAGYREIVDALVWYGMSAVPVIDADDRVVGVVSETDVLPKMVFDGDDPRARLFGRGRRRTANHDASGDTAAELMSSPAVTIGPDASIVEAARLMEAESVKRLPVVGDEGRLAGIVSRRDLLRGCLMPEAVTAGDEPRRRPDVADRSSRYIFEAGL
jgi:CBS domain-containing protein